jgi:hypothetical protein
VPTGNRSSIGHKRGYHARELFGPDRDRHESLIPQPFPYEISEGARILSNHH